MELKGSKTEANLWEAFAGESKARNKYDYFASKAKKDGFEQIAAIFQETANNEKEHAKIWAKKLGVIRDTTVENLAEADAGETYEWTTMYPEFARVAKEEGFNDIAALFEGVAAIEKEHATRYQKLMSNVKANEVFKKTDEKEWKCRNCGHIHKGEAAPEICPVCTHPKAYFEIEAENY